jgi:nucleoid-associated protein YgaU
MFADTLPRPRTGLIATLCLAAVLMLGHVSSSAGASHPRRHTVRSGETLWGIAEAGYPNSDPREAVYRIEQANHLSSAIITPGMVLRLP